MATVGAKTTYSGGPVSLCDGTPTGVSGWGYSRCITYTVLDQTQPGKPILNTSHYVANEQITKISATYNAKLSTQSGIAVNQDGQFVDFQALVSSSPLPGGTKGVFKQIITIVDTTNGQQYQVRVNCNVKTASDVAAHDVTAQTDQSCNGF
jgi:hypothetical protein